MVSAGDFELLDYKRRSHVGRKQLLDLRCLLSERKRELLVTTFLIVLLLLLLLLLSLLLLLLMLLMLVLVLQVVRSLWLCHWRSTRQRDFMSEKQVPSQNFHNVHTGIC